MGLGINDLKVCLHIFVISECRNLSPQLFECEEHNSDTCSWGNVIIITSRHQHGYLWPSLATLPIVDCFRQVFKTTSHIGTELLGVGFSWSSCLYSFMWKGSQEYITYELVPTSPVVSRMSGSSNLNSFRDGWSVAAQLLLCGMLPPWFVQYCSQHSCVVAVKLFLHSFS